MMMHLRLNVVTWLCHAPELRSVGGASTLQHQSSGMPSCPPPLNIHQSRTIQSWVKNPSLQTSIQYTLRTFCFNSVFYLLIYLLYLHLYLHRYLHLYVHPIFTFFFTCIFQDIALVLEAIECTILVCSPFQTSK